MRRSVALLLMLAAVGAACAREETITLRRADAGAKPGGTLVVAVPEPSAIDPALVSTFDVAANLVNQTMCDRFIQFDPVTAEPVPAIAESWVIANGGKTVTVKLRKGVRFSDGSAVTAEDAAYSLSRVAMAETASPVADLLRHVVGYDALHGESEDTDDSDQLAGISIIDNTSFEISLDINNADFFRLLGHAIATPIKKGVAKADPDAFASNPVCAGPYELARAWGPGDDVIELVRNPDYVAKNTGFTRGGSGYADVVDFRIVSDPVAAYTSGKADVAVVGVKSVDAARTLGPDFVRASAPVLEYIGLPANIPPFGDRAVRLALSLALDREQLVKDVWDGVREPATRFLPPTLGRSLSRTSGACAEAAPARGDVAQARKVFASSPVAARESVPIRLSFNDEFENRELMQAVAAQWRAAFPSLKVQLAPMPWEQYLQTANGASGFAGPFRMAWAPQFPSAEEYITPLFDSDNAGRTNLARFSNAELDRVLEFDVRRATGDDDRAERYQLVEDAACVQMPIVPIAYGSTHRLVRTKKVASATGKMSDMSSGEVVLRELYLR